MIQILFENSTLGILENIVMDKDDVSIPLAEINSPTPNDQAKANRPTKSSSNSFIFKIVFLILLILLILLLISTLTVVILRYPISYSNSSDRATLAPSQPPRIRIPNEIWNEYFLPPYITPTYYSITLQLLNNTYNITSYNLTNIFYGKVAVYFQSQIRTKFVVLHSNHLTIQSISLKKETGLVDVKIKNIIYDSFYNYMIIVVDSELHEKQTYVFDIKYYGKITTDQSGIITTIYNTVSTKQKSHILYSKLDPEGARKVFPCFDELNKKTTFTISIIHETKYQALANMPLDFSSNLNFSDLLYSENNWNKSLSLQLSQFKKTEIPMSPYLLAFTLLENYNYIEDTRETDKLVRLWYPNDLLELVHIPLNYSKHAEKFFERYFNHTSPLPKTDHVYIPDFLSGAMENWGLVTYRDRHLLVSPTHTPYQSKSSLMTIAHELAHIWFGNWLTTKAWGEIWLNEGFATYFASYAYYRLIGLDESTSAEFFLYERRNILNKDAKDNISPIITQVTDPLLFKNVFDTIVYYKGQMLLVWLESIMGTNSFHNAIKTYIKKFAEKNPTTEEFFDIIDEYGAAKSDLTNVGKLKHFFYPWLYKNGYPIVMVNYDLQKSELILTQKSVLQNSSINNKWPIHITYKTSELSADESIFFNNHKTLNRPLMENDFFVLNSNGKSYLRVNYSELLWERIIRQLNSSNNKINSISRIVLYDDAFYFVDSNGIHPNIIKRLIETFAYETNPIPWLTFYHRIFYKLFDFFKEDILFIKFSDFVVKISQNVAKKAMKDSMVGVLGLIDDVYQRTIITMSCDSNNNFILNEISNLFRNWIKYPLASSLPAHLVRPILYYGMKTNDNKANWKRLWDLLVSKENRGSLSDNDIMVGLAGTSKPSYLYKLLNYHLRPSSHKSNTDKIQSLLLITDWISKSTNGIIVLQRWITRRYADILRYGFGDNLFQNDQINQLDDLIKKIFRSIYEPHLFNPLIKIHKDSNTLIESVFTNNEWRETVGRKLIRLFQT